MLRSLAALVLSVALLSGCGILPPAHLYPVQGPLAAQTPPPIYPAKISSGFFSGAMKATLPGGQVTGSWHAQSPTDPAAGNLAPQWDAVYGQGFFVANVLGNTRVMRASLDGAQGLHLDTQFIFSAGPPVTAKGVAVDSQGNIYKLTL
jgi:hypothetical protein